MWAVLLAWACSATQARGSTLRRNAPDHDHHPGLHDVAFDDSGKLVFTQLSSETKRSTSRTKAGMEGVQALYYVNVNLDIEAMQSNLGVTMMFDKINHVMRLDAGISPVDGLAWGRYVDTINNNGWSELYLDTTGSGEVSNDVRMYSAGYIEGLITCVRMSEYYYNVHKLLMRTEITKHALANLKSLLKNQIGFMKFNANLVPHIMAEEPKDVYWKHSRYTLFQLWGMTDGYNYAARHFGANTLLMEDLLVLNSGGELPDILAAYTPKAKEDRAAAQTFAAMTFLQRGRRRGSTAVQNMKVRHSRFLQDAAPVANATEDPLDDAHWEKRMVDTGHCSALIKVTEHNGDIFVGHTTWDDYSKMTRIFKYYNFPFDGAATMATKIAFSSYPGVISSLDDFYVMSSGLTVMDTSLAILNPFIWDKVMDFPAHPHIPTFVHIMITNRLAKNAAHWCRLFEKQNVGTYASQWMIVDYNRFKAGQAVPDDTFWLLEAVPGLVHYADLSFHLRETSYWPSFNRPYFDDVRDVTGHKGAQRSHGSIYSWLNNPRAKIFAGAQGGINSLLEMRETMARNLYPFTGVLPAEPGHEISARMDLSPSMPIPNGGIDSKIVSRCLFAKMQVQAKSGPAHGATPVFQWNRDDGAEMWPGYPHNGMPNKWNYGWVQMTIQDVIGISDIASCET